MTQPAESPHYESPWLHVSAAHYEGHMSHPSVDQQAMLTAEFARAVGRWEPRRILVPGCATGQGLECLHRRAPERVTVVDLQREYLKLVCQRHAVALPALEIVKADLEAWQPDSSAYDLVHCALIVEYLCAEPFVARMARALAPAGVALFLLQLPLEGHSTVTLTPYREVLALEPAIRLVEPERLIKLAHHERLHLEEQSTIRLPSGKGFAVLAFRR